MSPSPADAGSLPSEGATGWVRKDVIRGKAIEVIVDGVVLRAFEGEALITALAASGRITLRHSPTRGEPRGMFCLMGVCQECVVEVDGRLVPSCMVQASDGMRVTTDALHRRLNDRRRAGADA